VAGRYRALLIGNSTYPADEHNLQTLKGPVKDIAVLNRALVDRDSGLFDDVDVTLLPETTSSRAIRALGRFFGTATREDVLLVYFSGHGKLDQSGRLHLCMQDTDSTDLLSTAVSSARINEFADASRARNVVIVLDCCHAGAFRGGELGEAVAGPGRYVLTSCRGTQLANDATVDNGTSYFTQHLVDGLIQAAADQDGDGYVTFSDLYAYVDQRLREAGKQIPQRRVDGDGDLPLAKRPLPAPADATAIAEPPVLEVSPPRLDLAEVPPGYTAELRVSNRGGGDLQWTYEAAGDFYRTERTTSGLLLRIGHQAGRREGRLVIESNGGHADIAITATIRHGPPQGPPAAGPPPGRRVAGNGAAVNGTPPAAGWLRPARPRAVLVAAAAAAVVLAGGVIATVVLLRGGSSGSSHTSANSQASGSFYRHGTSVIASAPWRLKINADNYGSGCSLTLINAHSGHQILREDSLYVTSTFQISQTGSFRWHVNNSRCEVVALRGSGMQTVPFSFDQSDVGDTDAFTAPPTVAVQVTGFKGSDCTFQLHDQANGQELDFATATRGKKDTVTLIPGGTKTVYLRSTGCKFRVYAPH
jgi:hypothetical protein